MQIGWRSFKKKCWRNVSDRIFSEGDFFSNVSGRIFIGLYLVWKKIRSETWPKKSDPKRVSRKKFTCILLCVITFSKERTFFFSRV